MPHVINGIGTWYCGSRNKIVRRDTCEHCHRTADLTSYDTTLFFTVVFIPVIPLAKKHIIDQCSGCGMHRAIKLAEWETMRAERIARAVAECRESPQDEDKAAAAIAVAATFESNETLEALEGFIGESHHGSAKVQSMLGAALERMNHHERATDAILRAHEIANTDETGEALAEQMFKHAEPRDALPLIDHVLERKKTESKWLTYLGVEALQARGMHADALALLARISAAFPESANDKHHKKYVKTSQKHRGTSKAVKSQLAQYSAKVPGASDNTWAGRWPWLLGPALVLLFAVWFVWAAFHKGSARDVWVVNGLSRPYKADIAGRAVTLQPYAAVKTTVRLGDVQWSVQGDGVNVPSGSVHINESFFARPFSRRVFVVNPDRCAVLIRETATYSTTGQVTKSGDGIEVFAGNALHEVPRVHYLFAPMPSQVQLQHAEQKSGLSVERSGPLAAARITFAMLGEDATKDLMRAIISQDPLAENVYGPAMSVLDASEFEAAVAPALAIRPVVIEAHRNHQSVVETIEPERDITAEYRALLAEDPTDPARMYLLARATHDGAEAQLLLETATGSQAPSPPAQVYMARAWAYLGQGRADEAVVHAKKAMDLDPNAPGVSENYRRALVLNGSIQELLKHPGLTVAPEDMSADELADKVYALCLRGDATLATNAITQAGNAWELAPNDETRMALLSIRAAMIGDWTEYERVATTPFQRMIVALRAGDLTAAQAAAKESDGSTGWNATLVYAIGAARAGSRDLAIDAIDQVAARMATGTWEERSFAAWLAGERPPVFKEVLMIPADPDLKRLCVTALGIKFPAISADCFALVRKLNGDRRPPHDIIEGVTGKD